MLDDSRRKELYSLLGDLPDRFRPISATINSTEPRGNGVVEHLTLDLNGIEPVPAYFAHPEKLEKPAPAILYNHAHGGDYSLGKDELLRGRPALQQPPYVDEFLSRGWCVLCIDHWAFGGRKGRSEADIFKHMLWHGQVMWGMMIYDSLRAIDYLVTRNEVDGNRLGAIGMSMGSTMAWWLAALDTRINVCVDICCLTDFQALIETNNLAGHGLYYYVPGLLKHFTVAQINALIAPRPHLSLAGNQDRLTPPAGLDRINAELRDVYESAGAPQAWRMFRQDVGHAETPEMRREVLQFLEKWL